MRIKVKHVLIIAQILLIFITVNISILFASPEKENSDLSFQSWNEKSGIPGNTITCLIQTQNGYIWFGTKSGLVRFDGINFHTYNSKNTPALTSDVITALFEEPDGTIWIGTENKGLFSFKNAQWKNYSTDNGLTNNNVNAISGDWDGNIWAGTDYGLNLISGSNIENISINEGLPDNIISALVVDNFGNLWIGTLRGGVTKYKEKVIQIIDANEGLENLSVTALYAEPKGKIWIGTLEGLFTLHPNENIVRYIKGTAYTPVTSILRLGNNVTLAGTMSDGFIHLKEKQRKIYNSLNGLPDDFIKAMLLDNSKSIWLGTEGSGLIKINNPFIRNLTENEGLPDNATSAVLEDRHGRLWVGTRNNGILQIRSNGKTILYNKSNGLSSNQVRVLFEDHLGRIWVGTYGGGINRISGKQITKIDERDGLSSNYINAISETKDRRIWVSTNKGLNSIYGSIVSVIKLEKETGQSEIRVIKQLKSGNMGIGTNDGFYISNGKKTEKTIPKNKDLKIEVRAIFEYPDSSVLIGTKGNGLFFWNGNKMYNCTMENGLIENQIFSIIEDSTGYLWLSGGRGISRIDRQKLMGFFNGEENFITVSLYDENEGMLSHQCYGEGSPASWITDNGTLYYPTNKGVAILDANQIKNLKNEPKTIIENVFLDDISILDEPSYDKFKNPEKVTFQFTGIEFSAPQKIYFKYKLMGLEEEYKYSGPHQEREAVYNNLPPGEYEFLIHAMGRDGVWDNKGASFKFSIIETPYSGDFATIIYVIILIFFIVIYLTLRKKRPENKTTEKYKTSALDPDRAMEVIPELNNLMKQEKIYLDPDLTMQILAKKLKIHYNHLSQIINEHYELSYNDFINKYRIEEAKKMLIMSKESGKNVLEIMLETGFYSKSVFNTAFKKFTGMTPSEYRDTTG